MSESVTLENDEVSVSVNARRGGRLTHLVNRRDRREWLIAPRGATGPVALDALFTDSDHCGWDEMLPTVDPCAYPGAPYARVSLPDHGELWSAPWDVVQQTPTSLHQRTVGRRLDFVFERVVQVRDASVLLTYRCETPVDTAMLWAAHPQFAAHEGTRLELTPSPSTVLTPGEGGFEEWDWRGDVVVDRDVALHEDLMLYVEPTQRVASASMIDTDGSTLTMTWDVQAAPYLAIWVDRGRHSAGRVIAVEPTNGFVDDLARAAAARRATIFQAARPLTWWVRVDLTQRGGRRT